MSRWALVLCGLIACSSDPPASAPEDSGTATIEDAGLADAVGPAVDEDAGASAGVPYPDPAAHPANRGPGGPTAHFAVSELYTICAYLDGGEHDVTDHHNLVTMYDGYLMMPFAPEFRRGGITFFDISNPCTPAVAGSGYSEDMRETHSVGLAELNGRRWAAVNMMSGFLTGGAQFWDVTDPTAPAAVSVIETPSFRYPDAYARVTLSVFWQVPYLYIAGADNGVFVVDATDPLNPVMVAQYPITPTLRAGQIQAIGNSLFVSGAESPRTVVLDISDPRSPQPLPGGDFLARDAMGTPREAYFSTFTGGYAWFARKDSGGGVIVYDLRDPTVPTFAGSFVSAGNGGYVFVKDGFAFVGESETAAIYDANNLPNITELARLDLNGDLDTIVPIGNVVVLSSDADSDLDKGSAIAPWRTDADTTPPEVTWWYPRDRSTQLPLTSRAGVTFSEHVDVKSVWEGSVRLYETGTNPAATRVDGYISVQETIVNFAPRKPLKPNTGYTLEIPAGGVMDFNGNRVVSTFLTTFTTAAR